MMPHILLFVYGMPSANTFNKEWSSVENKSTQWILIHAIIKYWKAFDSYY